MLPVLVPDPVVIVGSSPSGPHEWTAGVSGVWAPGALPVQFHVALPRSRDVGADEDAELDVALRAWPGVGCTSWRAAIGPPTSAPPADDGVNAIYFHDTVWPADLPAGVVATTVVHVDNQGRYHDVDIHLNGAAYTFSFDGRAGTRDLRSILTHELGHALGLGHSADTRATMYATNAGGVAWRSLEKDDQDGVCSLYPGVGATAGCDASPCPADFTCVAKTCERKGEIAGVCSPCARVVGACDGAGDDARCVDYAGGRACGRSCISDGDCGKGARCKPTTAAGDLQCVSDDACASAANTCQKDADCTFGHCVGGACLGPLDVPDAGMDASTTVADAGPTAVGSKGGCNDAGEGPGSGAWLWVLTAWARLSARGSGPSACSSPRGGRRLPR